MRSLAGLDREACDALVRELGEAPYRAGQLFGWVQSKQAASYDAMSNLPKAFRAKLAERMPVRSTRVGARHPSDDGTTKLLIELADGETVECVLIPEGDRRTACISTQVGCGVGCTFCASGADGVVRNLDASEIVEQVFWLTEEAGDRLTNIVVMGMGEPLHNVAALVTALKILQHPEGADLGSRRITVSTSGPKSGFAAFLASGVKVKLALSLHAAFDELRKELVPRGGSGTVAEIRRMARDWFDKTGRDVTFEYVLLDGVNDRDEDADALAALCDRHINVNLIPMNPVPFAPTLKAPPVERTERFAARLEKAGITVHLRRQRGDDVAAACGQLRLARQGG
ncbi:MAG: dual-specificity RNA methyltransferase RlmN [Planctomycetota bacterium]|jgi:23S rRNA (adenine2503-C2)-methyltransferase